MTIVLIETIPLLLDAIRRAIETISGNKVCSSALSLDHLAATLEETSPDLLWLDTVIPEVRDCSALKSIHKKQPGLKILLFGTNETLPEIRRYFKHGVSAYLPKTADSEEIEAALTYLETEDLYIPSSLKNAFAHWLTSPVRKKKPDCKLTQREREILQLIVEEFTSFEIAKKLYISQCTVDTHRLNLIQKLGVKNTAGLVRVAFEAGWYHQV